MFNNSIINQIPPVTKNLILVNVIIWLAMLLFPQEIGVMMDRHCGLHYYLSQDFIFTQFISYQFVHAGFQHLFFNMFALFMFGASVERVLGAKKFLFYYISCGVGAALIQEAVYAIRYFNAIQHLSTEDIAFITENGRAVLDSMHNFADKYAARCLLCFLFRLYLCVLFGLRLHVL